MPDVVALYMLHVQCVCILGRIIKRSLHGPSISLMQSWTGMACLCGLGRDPNMVYALHSARVLFAFSHCQCQRLINDIQSLVNYHVDCDQLVDGIQCYSALAVISAFQLLLLRGA
jgi:hypothetical protein